MNSEELFQVAQASAHLYGVIHIRDLRSVYYHYYPKENQVLLPEFQEEVEQILPKDKSFLMEDNLLMEEVLYFDQENKGSMLGEILQKQGEKPRYLPQKLTQFLLYCDEEYHRPTVEYKSVKAFFAEIDPDEEELEELLSKIRFQQRFSYDMESSFRTILEHNYLPPEKESQDAMIDLLIAMDATARKAKHKGYSLWELERTSL